MRLALIIATLFWTALHSGTAAADLYRWVDPESGSVKFSSYPPPWYGDEARERRAPKVEVIPTRGGAAAGGATAKPDTPVKGVDAPTRRNDVKASPAKPPVEEPR